MIGSKGDLKQGILGALTAGFNAKVLHPMKAGFNKLIAHGITGGVRSRLSGGSFKSGFLGLAVSYGASWSGAYEAAGVSSQANTWAQRAQNVIASYVFGGVAAELGGGKFANGGMSAAFSRMFNDLAVKLRDSAISLKDPVIQGLISGGNPARNCGPVMICIQYMRDKHNNPTDIPTPNPWDMNMSYLKILKASAYNVLGYLGREMYYESVCSSLNYYACRGKGAAWLPPED